MNTFLGIAVAQVRARGQRLRCDATRTASGAVLLSHCLLLIRKQRSLVCAVRISHLVILVAGIMRRVHAVVRVPIGIIRGGTYVGGGANTIVEELLVLVLDLLITARDSRDRTAQSLPRLLRLVAVVSGMSASIITHYARLLGNVAKVVGLVPPELLHPTGMVMVGVLIVAACAAAQGRVA